MPLIVPIVLGGAAILGSLAGVKKGYDGVEDFKTAKRLGEAAKDRYDRATRDLEAAREQVNTEAHRFGTYKLEVVRDTGGNMIRLLEELERRGKISALRHLCRIDFEVQEFVAELRQMQGVATSLLQGAIVGVIKGKLTGAAVYGLAGSIGVASTGVAIGGLSGAAATSATLAWLGGGALAAGGFGMFGGMVVLGGIVAMPVFLIAGYSVASKGAKALTEAKQYESEVNVAIEKMAAMHVAMDNIRKSMAEVSAVIRKLRQRTDAAIETLWAMVPYYDEHNPSHSAVLAQAMNLMKALTELLKAPVIGEGDGALNPLIPGLIARTQALLP